LMWLIVNTVFIAALALNTTNSKLMLQDICIYVRPTWADLYDYKMRYLLPRN